MLLGDLTHRPFPKFQVNNHLLEYLFERNGYHIMKVYDEIWKDASDNVEFEQKAFVQTTEKSGEYCLQHFG